MGGGLLILLLNIFILYYIYRYIIIIISIFINIYNSLFFFLPSIPFGGGGYVILKLSSVICHEGVTNRRLERLMVQFCNLPLGGRGCKLHHE